MSCHVWLSPSIQEELDNIFASKREQFLKFAVNWEWILPFPCSNIHFIPSNGSAAVRIRCVTTFSLFFTVSSRSLFIHFRSVHRVQFYCYYNEDGIEFGVELNHESYDSDEYFVVLQGHVVSCTTLLVAVVALSIIFTLFVMCSIEGEH